MSDPKMNQLLKGINSLSLHSFRTESHSQILHSNNLILKIKSEINR